MPDPNVMDAMAAELRMWEAAFAAPDPGWTGFTNDRRIFNGSPPEPYEVLLARAKDLGLILCTCRTEQRGERKGQVLVYVPGCPVHSHQSQR